MSRTTPFTKDDCIRGMYEKGADGLDNNEGLIAIIDLENLSENYKKPEYQLYRLSGGFGCKPSGMGRACYGKFCFDGLEDKFGKGSFLGIANEEVTKYAEQLESVWQNKDKIIEQNRQSRVAIYVRSDSISDDKTQEKMLSQSAMCREYAEKNNLKIVKEVWVMGLSGMAQYDNCKELQGLEKMAENGHIDGILVGEPQAISRNTQVLSQFVQRLKNYGAELVSSVDGEVVKSENTSKSESEM